MKTFSGTFNGQKYMGVEHNPSMNYETFLGYLLIDSTGQGLIDKREKIRRGDCNGFYYLGRSTVELLGTYHTKGEIDFQVDKNWVEYITVGNGKTKYPKDYSVNMWESRPPVTNTAEKSLLSLLDRDSRMAFPLEENPYGEGEPIVTNGHGYPLPMNWDERVNLHDWRESESQVRPKSFLIILVN